ncbi:MAG: penicillin-binding protein [Candidatus Omnitrophica bacterium]|nr:penicillin-binding protein [Candidatus Omnitrophota bacterium]
MQTRRYRFRLGIITLTFTIILTLISIRLIYIQVFQHKRFVDLANNQHSVTIVFEPTRGAILDRNMRKLAVDLKVDSVYAVSRDVDEKEKTARKLAPILGKDKGFLYERLSRDKQFVWLARKVTKEQAGKVSGLNLKGIHLIDERKRFYPNGSLASQTIGFCDIDSVGLEGLESHYNKYLRGRDGYRSIIRDAKSRELYAFEKEYVPPVNGYNLVLTIDQVIQHTAEKALKKAIKKHNAKAGVAVVMEPATGDILALAVEPSYDINDFQNATSDSRRNRAITDYYEPGSVFKVVTASACLNEGVVSLEDNFFCENGAWYVAGHTLHDHRGHGNMTFREVIEKSSNIGTVKAAMKLGDKALYRYIRAYGFGTPTGIEFPGEIPGKVRPLSRWSRYSMTAVPMGQEIAATPIQLTACIAAIANDGVLMKPRLVSEIIDSKGEVIKEYKPIVKRRVISHETSVALKEIMQGVVERGTGKRARITDYTSAGKTGTSQKVEPSGRYSHSKFIASFAGFAPADEPVVAICVMIDEPHPVYFGGSVSAPVFKEIAEATLKYMEVEPKPKKTKESLG